MASPTAAGIAALIAEYYQVKKERKPASAEVKALLVHTATDAGIPGPDPTYGHGVINALRAGEVIRGSGGEIVRFEEVSADQSKSFSVEASTGPVRATIAWTDPPADASTSGLNDPTPKLQNDLDLTVTAPDGKVYHPYRLSLANPLSPAMTDGPNRADNVEVLDAPAAPGTWKVEVKPASLKSGDRQSFALIVTGLKEPG